MRPADDLFGPVTPLRITLGELVEISRNLYESSGHGGIARVVLALVGIDVPLTARLEPAQCLIGLALAALDRDISDIDRLHEEFSRPPFGDVVTDSHMI
jgi:hypothetical protein